MIYLDSAATTFLKPASVKKSILQAMNTMSSPGRGGYRAAMRAAYACYDCRETAGEMFNCLPENIALTFNATHGLNIAINSLVSPGDKVVISGYEHNAVTRPLAAKNANICTAMGGLFCPGELMKNMRRLLPGAKCCACTHVSNVFGYVLPIEDVAVLCREYGVPLIVDASQSAGVLPVDMGRWNAAFVAMPGHKGLHGPQGTGLLLCGSPTEPLLYGGTGSMSRSRNMPDMLPDRLEAGTHNMPGVCGLLAGMRFVGKTGIKNISAHECALRRRLAKALKKIPNTEVFESGDDNLQSGVLSARFGGTDCQTMAEKLADRGVAVRAGLHCAPLAHETAGTIDTGTVRFSFSPFNTMAEITRTAEIIREIMNKT